MLWYLIVLAVVGFVAGLLARAILPGDDSMGIGATILVGLAGSFVGGLVVGLIFQPDDGETFAPVGLVGSVFGAVIVLMIYRAANGRSAIGRR
jgi:uncharacterized membrane protein YeaQ/YmgE (transglycosylase-associated protein family)